MPEWRDKHPGRRAPPVPRWREDSGSAKARRQGGRRRTLTEAPAALVVALQVDYAFALLPVQRQAALDVPVIEDATKRSWSMI